MQPKKRTFLTLMISLLISLPVVSNAWSLDKFIVFGDSLSDSGNTYGVTNYQSDYDPTQEVAPVSPPYYSGHFSNGLVWDEYLAQDFGFNIGKSGSFEEYLSAVLGIPLQNDYTHSSFRNYAYGGSWVEPESVSHKAFPPSLETEVNLYVSEDNDADKDHHLYSIWSGANDYLGERDSYDVDTMTSDTVNALGNQIRRLADSGGKYFLILNLPDLGKIPLSQIAGPNNNYAQFLSFITSQHNQKLASLVQQLKNEYPHDKFMLVDIYGVFTNVMNTHQINGVSFANSTEPCYSGAMSRVKNSNQTFDPACQTPDNYVFWDLLHPTTKAHRQIAKLVLATLENNGLSFKGNPRKR